MLHPNASAKLQRSLIRVAAHPPPFNSFLCQLQRSLASAVEDSNFLFELRAEMVALHFEIVPRLQIEPEPVTSPEIPGEAEGCVR